MVRQSSQSTSIVALLTEYIAWNFPGLVCHEGTSEGFWYEEHVDVWLREQPNRRVSLRFASVRWQDGVMKIVISIDGVQKTMNEHLDSASAEATERFLERCCDLIIAHLGMQIGGG